ncbi:serine esterase protein [Cystoisospora suis]|uniref:Serine esterase protein n=1 Tax=Cystoisospora suis TaxID=483139 RepID=A0A2C6KL90_9APIC|nr:serine esterase protein [Cystoisospora suis]
MDAVGPMAASVLEPGEEPFNPNFFSFRAFTTASYREKPATCRSSSVETSDRAQPGVPSRPGEPDRVDAEVQRLRQHRSSSCDSPANAPLTDRAGEQGESPRLPTSSSFSALLSLGGPCSPPFSPSQRLINTLSPLGFFGRGRTPEDEGGDKTVSASADCRDNTCQDSVNSTRRSILTSFGEAEPRQTSPLSRLFFFSSSTPASTSSVGSESLPGSTSPGVGQEPVPPLCLVVCIHGLAGAESDFRYMAERLKERSPLVRVLLSTANTGKTFDGVRKGGERLAEEVRRDVRRHPSLRYICFIGFSLGGLYMRYAVRLLYTPPSGAAPATVCGLTPLCIGTVASPHLGVRRFSYVPLPEGFLRPLISSYLRLTSRLRGNRKGSRGLGKKSSDSMGLSSGRISRGESVPSLTSLAFEAGTDGEEGQGGRRERYSISGREEETRRSDGCVSPSAAQQVYAQAAAEFIVGGESEVLAQAESEDAEEESSCGPNLGRLSQLYESTTLADLMLLSASEQKRELEMQGEKTGGTPFWFWGRSQSHNETNAVAEHETKEQNTEESQEGNVEKEADDDEPLLVQMSKGVFVESLQAFKHRRLYANARGDILVPLGTAAIEPALPSNPQLQLLLQQARRSMIAGCGRIVMIVQPDGTPMPTVGDSPSSPMSSVPSFWGSAPVTATQEASPFFSCQSSFATEFPCTSEATALSSLTLTPSAQLAQSGLSPEQSATLENSCSVDFTLSPGSQTWRDSGSPSVFYETSSVPNVSPTEANPTAESLQKRNACDSVRESQLSHPPPMARKDRVVLPVAVGEEEGNVCESVMSFSVERSTQSDSIQDVSHVNEKSHTSSVLTVSSSISTADPGGVSSGCSDDEVKEKPTIIQACEVSASTTTSRSTGSSIQESFLERRLLSTSSLAGWTDWLKLNTYGDVEAAMANRLNEVQWTKFIVDFPNLIPVAHDSINASGKSRFRTWVTSAGRPIVEQMVDWFIFSLHEALQQDVMPREASGRASVL